MLKSNIKRRATLAGKERGTLTKLILKGDMPQGTGYGLPKSGIII
jgi:hypothetical protein